MVMSAVVASAAALPTRYVKPCAVREAAVRAGVLLLSVSLVTVESRRWSVTDRLQDGCGDYDDNYDDDAS